MNGSGESFERVSDCSKILLVAIFVVWVVVFKYHVSYVYQVLHSVLADHLCFTVLLRMWASTVAGL